jgi:hypothetical protein
VPGEGLVSTGPEENYCHSAGSALPGGHCTTMLQGRLTNHSATLVCRLLTQQSPPCLHPNADCAAHLGWADGRRELLHPASHRGGIKPVYRGRHAGLLALRALPLFLLPLREYNLQSCVNIVETAAARCIRIRCQSYLHRSTYLWNACPPSTHTAQPTLAGPSHLRIRPSPLIIGRQVCHPR